MLTMPQINIIAMFCGMLYWEVHFGVRMPTNGLGKEGSEYAFIYKTLHQQKWYFILKKNPCTIPFNIL